MNPRSEQRGLLNFRLLLGFGSVLFLILAIAYFFYGLQPSAAAASTQSVQFKIAKGEGLRDIGARLSQGALVKSISVFKLYSLISGKAQKFQPGVYELSSSMSVTQIDGILPSSGKDEATVILQEGMTLKDFDEILSQAGVIRENSIISYQIKNLAEEYPFLSKTGSIEGFLFPDTYRFRLDSSEDEVIHRLLDNFQAKVWPLLADKNNWYETLILASYLEREVPDFNDRQLVTGILLKRLKNGTPLQVDSTISYAKCDGEFKDCKNAATTKSDLSLSSPYNTYEHLGLTPTPISNPGQAAIKAALTPQSSPYWYYLSEAKTKETIFSKTLQEHNINRAKFL